jgi:hypothetical protein
MQEGPRQFAPADPPFKPIRPGSRSNTTLRKICFVIRKNEASMKGTGAEITLRNSAIENVIEIRQMPSLT